MAGWAGAIEAQSMVLIPSLKLRSARTNSS